MPLEKMKRMDLTHGNLVKRSRKSADVEPVSSPGRLDEETERRCLAGSMTPLQSRRYRRSRRDSSVVWAYLICWGLVAACLIAVSWLGR